MASKRRLRRRSCEGKIRHVEVDGAYAHSKSLGWPYHPYKCKFCKGYHIGRYSFTAIRSMKKKK